MKKKLRVFGIIVLIVLIYIVFIHMTKNPFLSPALKGKYRPYSQAELENGFNSFLSFENTKPRIIETHPTKGCYGFSFGITCSEVEGAIAYVDIKSNEKIISYLEGLRKKLTTEGYECSISQFKRITPEDYEFSCQKVYFLKSHNQYFYTSDLFAKFYKVDNEKSLIVQFTIKPDNFCDHHPSDPKCKIPNLDFLRSQPPINKLLPF